MNELMGALLEVALSNAALATALALAAWLIRRVAERAALVHGLCLLALVKLITPPLLPLPILPASAPAPVPVPVPAPVPVPVPVPALAGPAWLAALSLAGSVILLGLWVARGRRFRRLLAFAGPAPAALRERAAELAGRLGLARVPVLRIVSGRLSPMVCPARGAPLLVLPAGLLARLDDAARDALLLHELAHLRRGDHRVRWLEAVVVALYWWFPPVWWLRAALREAEERCCDAWVVWANPERAQTYARALLSTVDFLSEPAVAAPQLACGAGAAHDLKTRLKMIMEQSTQRSLGRRGRLAVAALAVVVLPALPTRAQGERTERDERSVRAAQRELGDLRRELEELRASLEKLGRREEQPRQEDHAARLRERIGPTLDHLKQARVQAHEQLEQVHRHVHEHVRKALDEARAQLHQHLGPEVREQVQQHVRKALDEARAQLHEHLGPKVHEQVQQVVREAMSGVEQAQRALDLAGAVRARRDAAAEHAKRPGVQQADDAGALHARIKQLEDELRAAREELREAERRGRREERRGGDR
jgi:beta-lactamase regulating signal transducer with metallopeptidase domain